MASKLGFAGGIPERRVRPIWDAVDSRQYKNALKLVAALLGKHPNSPYAIALKALIIERMGKPEEALSLCNTAKEIMYSDEAPYIDEITLSTLQIVFQRLDQSDQATSCYEHACKKYPNNMELMMGLFNCYVRECSFVKQQQVAMKMYKLVGEERFLLWAVCSIQLQVFCGNGGEKLLELAEALLKKHISSHSLHEPEALLVYVAILEEQSKYETALEVVSGKLGSLIGMEVEKLRIKGRLLSHARPHEAAEVFQEVLQSCPDDWDSLLHYLDCLFEDCGGNNVKGKEHDTELCLSNHLLDELFNLRFSSAMCFIQKFQMENEKHLVRCPYMATIELERRRFQYLKVDNGSMMEAILDYCRRYGHLTCCSSDVEEYLNALAPQQKSELSEKWMKHEESTSVAPIVALGHSLTTYKVKERLGVMSGLSNQELEAIVLHLTQLYCESLILFKDLDPQENMQSEDLLSIACNVLVQLYWRSRNLGYFLEAIMVLEFGLAIRSFVWQFKVLLLHLYGHCGALSAAYECHRKLDIKNILFESALHNILSYLPKSPMCSDLNDLFKEYLKFSDDYSKEAAELTFLAYQHRNYSKVLEFVKFRNRMVHSHQYLLARIEHPILQLKQKTTNLEEAERFLTSINFGCPLMDMSKDEQLKALSFNEDLQIRPWWTPALDVNYLLDPFDESLCSRDNQGHVKEEHDRQLCSKAKRSLLPRLVHLSIEASGMRLWANTETNGPVPEHVTSSELKTLLGQYTSIIGVPLDNAIQALTDLAVGDRPLEVDDLDLVDWLNLAVFVNAWKTSSSETASSSNGHGAESNSWITLDGLVERSASLLTSSSESVSVCCSSTFPVLVQLVMEPFSWHLLIIQAHVRSVQQLTGKKKKKTSVDKAHSPLLISLRTSMDCLHNALEHITMWLAQESNTSEEKRLDSLVSLVNQCSSSSSSVGSGPGLVLEFLRKTTLNRNPELGERISQGMQSWNPVEVLRKFAKSQHLQVAEFQKICKETMACLAALKQSI